MRNASRTCTSSLASPREEWAAIAASSRDCQRSTPMTNSVASTVIRRVEPIQPLGVQQLAGVSVLGLDSQQNVESGGACGRDGHRGQAPTGSSLRGR